MLNGMMTDSAIIFRGVGELDIFNYRPAVKDVSAVPPQKLKRLSSTSFPPLEPNRRVYHH